MKPVYKIIPKINDRVYYLKNTMKHSNKLYNVYWISSQADNIQFIKDMYNDNNKLKYNHDKIKEAINKIEVIISDDNNKLTHTTLEHLETPRDRILKLREQNINNLLNKTKQND
jgi:hypothetical protein